MAYTAINFVQSSLGNLVNQNLHGFYVGEIVQLSGATYIAAKADTINDAESIGMVSNIVDVNNFVLTQVGFVYNIEAAPALPFTAGTLYYLSDTVAGAIQVTPGAVVLPLFYANSPDSGYFFNSYPNGGSSSGLIWETVTMDTAMLPNRGYVINGAGPLNMTLPAVFSVGDVIEILGASGNGWVIGQQNTQSIIADNLISTIGPGGSVASNDNWNAITIQGIVANTQFQSTSTAGTVIVT